MCVCVFVFWRKSSAHPGNHLNKMRGTLHFQCETRKQLSKPRLVAQEPPGLIIYATTVAAPHFLCCSSTQTYLVRLHYNHHDCQSRKHCRPFVHLQTCKVLPQKHVLDLYRHYHINYIVMISPSCHHFGIKSCQIPIFFAEQSAFPVPQLQMFHRPVLAT